MMNEQAGITRDDTVHGEAYYTRAQVDAEIAADRAARATQAVAPVEPTNENGFLPCPFCGSSDVSESIGATADGAPWQYVECEGCAACTEYGKWNDRATPPAAPVREPFGYVNTHTGQFFRTVEACCKGNEGHWRTVYTHPSPQAVGALVADLRLAAETLRKYETLHRAKGTDESTEKAEVNAALAVRFEATLSAQRGGE